MFGNFAKLDSPRRLVQFWQNLQTSLVLLIPNCTRQRMITYTNLCQYEQLINEPTRVTTDNASLIDHFYTTKPDLITSSGVRIITISDHYSIYGIRKFYTTKEVVEYRDFKHFNENNFLFELESLSSLNLDHLDPNNSWLTWKNKFLHIVNKHAPLKKRRVSKKRVPWLICELKYYKRQKAYLKRKATLSNLDDDWAGQPINH